mgnify:CR=1 FL=1
MKNQKKTDGRKITLKRNNILTNDPCAFCGGRCDPGGFDYFVKGTGRLVCDQCAEKYAPELVEIQKAALAFSEMETSMILSNIRGKIREAINEPLEKRLLKSLDDIFGLKEDVPF